jgi:hypothetical protein
MEAWDEDYLDMEVQAYLRMDAKGLGDFQFGLVSGQIDGELEWCGDEDRMACHSAVASSRNGPEMDRGPRWTNGISG